MNSTSIDLIKAIVNHLEEIKEIYGKKIFLDDSELVFEYLLSKEYPKKSQVRKVFCDNTNCTKATYEALRFGRGTVSMERLIRVIIGLRLNYIDAALFLYVNDINICLDRYSDERKLISFLCTDVFKIESSIERFWAAQEYLNQNHKLKKYRLFD